MVFTIVLEVSDPYGASSSDSMTVTAVNPMQEVCYDKKDGDSQLWGLPLIHPDFTVESVFWSTPEIDWNFVITQGLGSFYLDTDDDGHQDTWSGNLVDLDHHKGYWVNSLNFEEETYEWCYPGYAHEEPVEYDLIDGNNLISYLGADGCVLEESLGEIAECVQFIIGEGVGLFHLDDGSWAGNLSSTKANSGYWMNIGNVDDEFEDTFEFSWECDGALSLSLIHI